MAPGLGDPHSPYTLSAPTLATLNASRRVRLP